MADRSLGRRWLNRPWFTDWVVWVAAAVGIAATAAAIARQTDLAGPDLVLGSLVYVLAGAALAVACGGLLALARAVFLVLLRVKPGRQKVLTLTVRLRELGASVTYTRDENGIVTASVRGVPLRRRLEVLAASRAHAERHGFLESTSVDEDAKRPGQ